MIAKSTMINPLLWWVICAMITTLCVSLYYHRSITHRSLTLHPILEHISRFIIWLTSGMDPWIWAAVHRWHHQNADTENDIHSPKVRGFWNLLIHGYYAEIHELYIKDTDFYVKYGQGAPDDWIEQNIYRKFPNTGLYIMLLIDIILCGVWGPWVWLGHFIWKEFLNKIIAGIGHQIGYRNYETDDRSRNIFPWGIIILGEELHNNHHQNSSSPNFHRRWFEIDPIWYVIKILCWCRLCKLNYEPEYYKDK